MTGYDSESSDEDEQSLIPKGPTYTGTQDEIKEVEAEYP